MKRTAAVSVSALALFSSGLVAAVGWPADQAATRQAGPAPLTPAAVPGSAQLVSYNSCSSFLSAVKARALEQVGPYGLPGEYPGNVGGAVDGPAMQASAAGAPLPVAAAPASASAGAFAGTSSSSSDSFSATNDQVSGIDEPDTVKTNGTVMAVLRTNPVGLEVLAVGGLVPHVMADLPLPEIGYPTGLFLTDGDAVVLSQGPPAGGVAYTPTSVVTVVSLADPSHPSVTRSFTITGAETAARLVNGRVILVIRHTPSLRFAPPFGPSGSAVDSSGSNRSVIQSSTLADWLPTVTSEPSGIKTTVGCKQSWMADQAGSSFTTVSVVSIEPSSDRPGPTASVMGGADTVYASADALFVASTDTGSPAAPTSFGGAVAVPYPSAATSTRILEFSLSGPAGIRYVGSGTVPGQMIGRYAMDEYRGTLRVATTTGQATPPPNEGPAPTQLSDSRITVLETSGGNLAPVGTVTGLGSGEKIYSVRFEGPLAYVVTFRQTDPLYVVDLSDPAHPVQKGRLALTGFSSFLQPLSGSLLLGVGQSVDSNLRQNGLQLSVFDVADPAAPALESRVQLPGGYSQAQYDPHALLWWPLTRLIAMPVSDPTTHFVGVAVWHVDAAGLLQSVARLAPPAVTPPTASSLPSAGPVAGTSAAVAVPALPIAYGSEREVVVGNLLYTVSPGGIMASEMTTWNTVAWLPFT